MTLLAGVPSIFHGIEPGALAVLSTLTSPAEDNEASLPATFPTAEERATLPSLFHMGLSSLSDSTLPCIVSPLRDTYCPLLQRRPKHRIWVHSPAKPSVQLPWALHTYTVPSKTEHEKPCHTYTFTLPSGPHLFKRQQHELLCLGHLHEVLEDILVCRLEEVAAGMRVSKTPDPQAVGWVELAE